ncbi:hypothetical protein ACFLUF_02840 [Chloroflexota bacterium]
MIKNKKGGEAIGMSLGGIGRILLTLGLLVVIVAILWDPLKISASGITDSDSFELFINEINGLTSDGIENPILHLSKGSAVVGFSEGENIFECSNCYPYQYGSVISITTVKINRPTDECEEGLCVCLCSEGFELEQENGQDDYTRIDSATIRYNRVGKCTEEYDCRTIDTNLVKETILNVIESKWRNGFLFVVGLADDGFKKYNDEDVQIYIERKGNFLGVCNEEVYRHTENKIGQFGCIQ